MAFSTNPLSLSVPEPAFESWLRDSGYLEVLDHHSSVIPSSGGIGVAAGTNSNDGGSITTSIISGGVFASLLSGVITLLSLFTLNPFAKVTTLDFSGETPSWTRAFFGDCGSYSFPSGTDQARRRVQENVKRYARNYASLFILIFASTLYQMPLALVGLLSSLAVWDMFKFCSNRWDWYRYPIIRQLLVRTAQCATVVMLVILNVQMALFCALAVSYAVMLLHAAFRKLTPAKQSLR
ncbi:hypothetical protein Tsubulata_006444 [Turnera subulata]|uniref:PRA1 family protein n=1 Tax=Turnera subulata TaxID=218843 RepID=A0A9Q0G085_9ROSI|nr:hypothetical protein Tsubulata_006444 [Turnera subulata]